MTFRVIEEKVTVIHNGKPDTRPTYIVVDDADDLNVCSVTGRSIYCRPVAQRIAALLNEFGLLDIEAEMRVTE